jgi:hypothetical protein
MPAVVVSTDQAGLVTFNGFNNNAIASISFDDGSGIHELMAQSVEIKYLSLEA